MDFPQGLVAVAEDGEVVGVRISFHEMGELALGVCQQNPILSLNMGGST